jgi:hypothetical protein
MDKTDKMFTKILKFTTALFAILVVATSCTEDTIENWKSNDYIQFSDNYTNFYSFVYAGSTVQKDTVKFRVNLAGNLSSRDRKFTIKQVKTYDYIYQKDQFGNIIDSAFVELPNQAIPGVHYETIAGKDFIIPSDSLGVDVKVVVIRDPSLKNNDYSLSLKVEESEDFKPGNIETQKVTLTLSDKIIEPTIWNTFAIGNTTVFGVMGYYGKVKHQLLIDVTKKRWDDSFIRYDLSEEYLVFYKLLAVQELERINDERLANGLNKLREDENNPNSEVYFF